MGSPTGLVRRVLPQVAVLVASVLVVVLAVKNRELRAGYQDFYDTVRFPHPGAYVPIFKAVTLAGDSSTSSRDRTSFWVFSATPWTSSALRYSSWTSRAEDSGVGRSRGP